jgi:monovalent cation:proton antiporter-2 (CPA2) family protein
MGQGEWIRELMIVLATAGVVVPLFGRLRFGPVIGFLIAGAILGPGGLGHLSSEFPWLRLVTFSDTEHVRPFAEMGVIFLLFLIGLEFSLERLWAMRRAVLGIGSLQVLLSVLVIGLATAWSGAGMAVALVVGMALALSSTAIASQLMIESHRFATPVGRLAIGVLLFQDLMVVPIVIIVGVLGHGGDALPVALLRAVGMAIVAVALILTVGRFVVTPLLRLAATTRSRELLIAVALFLAIGTALITQLAGLSAALGAFLAGMLLGESEFRHQIEVDIDPFKGLLLGLFFMTVGMSFDLSGLGSQSWLLVAAVILLLAFKLAANYGAMRLFRVERAVATETAFVLAGAGEFALVVFTLAERDGVLSPATYQDFLSVAVLSMVATPAMAAVGRRLGGRLAARRDTAQSGVDPDSAELADHIVIGGFGRVGRTVARLLDATGIAYVALDLNAGRVARERAKGRSVFYGDASRHEILKQVGGGAARAFVVTPDGPVAAERMVRAIRSAWPDAAIYARALDADHARGLSEAGATSVVPEALEGSLQLGGRVLAGLGVPEDAIETYLTVQRDAEIRRLAGDVQPKGRRLADPKGS